jgi:hypothetical protein
MKRFSKKYLILIFLLVCFAFDAMGQTTQSGTPASPSSTQPTVPATKDSQPAAQTPGTTAGGDVTLTDLPPLPPMKNVITTEKKVPSIPTGVIPRVKQETPADKPAPLSSSDDRTKDATTSGSAVPTKTAPAGGPSATAALPAVPTGSVVPQIPLPGGSTPPQKDGQAAKADSSALAVVPPQKQQATPSETPKQEPAKKKGSDTYREEMSLFNVPTANLRTMKVVIDDKYNLVGMVYGEERGFIRILSSDNMGNFTEIWKSPPLNSPVRGIFVENLDRVGETEIVAYTADGNIFIYGYDSHDLKYRTPEGTYQGIQCMCIANLDNTPEMEILFITSQGKMVQFDPKTKFELWRSSDTYLAADMIIGNVDNDKDPEIILNTGEVLNSRFKTVKWKSDIQFGQRLYLIDIDGDDILELVTEYDEQYIKIFDIDQRREKW